MTKENLQMEESEGTFEEAIEDEPNDEIQVWSWFIKPLCALVYFSRYQEDFKDADR